MTTRDPGARVVLTHGLEVRPLATALRATSPGATMTWGLEVLVHEVMAATTTWPSAISSSPLPSREAVWALGSRSSAVRNQTAAASRVTRSWGRDGQALLGTTVARSSSTTWE